MKCEFCSAEWEGESTICPECGMDNAPEENDTPKKMGAGKIALLAVLAVAAVAVVVALVMGALKNKPETPEATEPSETVEAGEVQAEDGDPNTVAAKANYTASDADAIAARDTVVATMGSEKLTNGMLQIYYWMSYYDFMSSYGSYASYLGLDTSMPLDQQTSPDGVSTWQQYFLTNALTAWQQFHSLALEAEANGFTMPAESKELIDKIPENLLETAKNNGYATVEDMLLYSMGPAASVEDYQQYMYEYELGYLYFQSKAAEIEVNDADVENYFNENEESFAEQGITKDTITVDVRHVLIQPENGETGADGKTTYTEEAWDAALTKAKTLLQAWKDGEATEESFAELAQAESQDPGSVSNGGLYEGVELGQMVAPFEEWCFDASRQHGDTGLVKTDYGYHIMFFVQSNSVWFDEARTALLSEKSSVIVTDAASKYEVSVDYPAIVLGEVPVDPNEPAGE